MSLLKKKKTEETVVEKADEKTAKKSAESVGAGAKKTRGSKKESAVSEEPAQVEADNNDAEVKSEVKVEKAPKAEKAEKASAKTGSDKKLDYYKSKLNEDKTISFSADIADMSSGQFKTLDGDITLVLNFKDVFKGELSKESLRYKAIGMVGRPIDVTVSSIDEEQRIVTVTKNTYVARRESNARQKIEEGLLKNEPVTMKARVFYVFGKGDNSGALVGLIGTGLTGIIWLREWSTEYTSDVNMVAKVGDEFDVKVVGKNDSTQRADYKCSRAAAMASPWIGIEDFYKRGDIVAVKVVDHWQENFCGRVPNYPEINVKVQNPKADKVKVYVGGVYACEVVRASEKGHAFIARAIKFLHLADDEGDKKKAQEKPNKAAKK